jgi:hypothetical protein
MPKIFGQLEKAQFEVLASDVAAGTIGRTWWNSTSGQQKVDDGTNIRAVIRNDAAAIIGNSGTANNNIRLHRGANGVLQFVTGGDATAEGTLSTSINQLSARLENYINSSLPAAGNAGRTAWVSDQGILKVDNGTAWLPVGSGGGGGGSLRWVEDANAPIPEVENLQQVYMYSAGLGQSLYALIKVPQSYIAGFPIALKMSFYSPDSSGTALLQTVATLIKSGVDVISDTTNQRTSTNAAVTLSAGTVNIPQVVSFDLTSTTGQINSIAVAANDLIKVQLTRGTDTATSDIRALTYGTEATFT